MHRAHDPIRPVDLHRTQHLALHARSGDRERLEALYMRTLPALMAWLTLRQRRGLLRGISIEDATQETWTRALAGFQSYDPEVGNFRAWLTGIARRIACDAAAARFGQAQDDASAVMREKASEDRPTLDELVRQDSIARFVAYSDSLPTVERVLLRYLGLEGRPAEFVALLLDLPVATVQKRWQRQRERMRTEGIGSKFELEA